jgi:asparagine synthase (glutamine-hydrolysing)
LRHAADLLAHRGPDDYGIWYDTASGIGFGHRRLSIIDVSPSGHQPMFSTNRRYVITYNGEVYNYPALRKELSELGYVFRGHSDTETLLAGFEQWGIEETVRRSIGMFALAVWDRQERRLHLVRDRLGIKPLYYGRVNSAFIFASELKAFHAVPEFQNPVQERALELYLRYGYIPAPYSIYENIYKLLPGSILTVETDSLQEVYQPKSYWSAREIALSGQAHPEQVIEQEAIEQLDVLLSDAVDHCMVSDVPVGLFLSGGIDSSTVAAFAQIQSTQPVKTFCIGFEDQQYDEAIYAKAVAHYLGTDHTEMYLSPKDAQGSIPRMSSLYDEPFSDPSQIPTFLVSELARSQVAVSLSGDGGDELFGGYKRYALAQDVWRRTAWLGSTGRKMAAGVLKNIPAQSFGHGGSSKLLSPLFERYGRNGLVSDKLRKLSFILAAETPQILYDRIISNWQDVFPLLEDPGEQKISSLFATPSLLSVENWIEFPDFVHRMMYFDLVTYLPDNILVKLDRASMSVGLEGRVPLLDHRVVEFAWRLPLHMKTRNNQSKWLLKQVLFRHLPKEMVERPKTGFGIPIGEWLRGSLRDWAESLLDGTRLKSDGYFEPKVIRQFWSEHLSGKKNQSHDLWVVLMFQAWLENSQRFERVS